MSDDPLEYARAVATDDVQATLDWLLTNGFAAGRTEGGRGAAFGDVVVELRRGDEVIQIVRDRSQWMCSVGHGGAPARPLEDVLSEMGVVIPEPPRDAEPLAGQLPSGIPWREAVPAVLDWLRTR